MKLKSAVTMTAVLALSLAGAGPLASTATFKKAMRFTQKGEQALKAGDIDRARASFEKALTFESGLPTAHAGLGHVAMAGDDAAAALEHYQTAVSEYSRFGGMVEEIQAQKYRSAQSEITSLRDSINQLSGPGVDAQWANMQISKIELTISRLQVIEPPNPEALGEPPAEFHFYVGNAMFKLGRLDGAVEAWERCRDAKPKFAMVYNNLALAYWKQGRMDEAVAALDTAEALGFPVNPDFRRDLAKAAASG